MAQLDRARIARCCAVHQREVRKLAQHRRAEARRRVQGQRRGSSWDQLARLAGLSEEELLPITGRQMTGGQSKAAAIIEAAGRLVGAGVTRSDDFRVDSPVQQEAYTGVKGLGPVTWTYLGMLLGHSGVKADRMICRYVSDAVGHDVDPSDAAVLVTEVAASLGKSASELDHAIWTFQRRRKGEK